MGHWPGPTEQNTSGTDNNDKNLAFLLKSDKKLLVIHHKGQSNGGLITNSFDAFEECINYALQAGYRVCRIRTHCEVESRSVTNEDFLEILSDGSPGSMDVFAIAQCDYFIGASSGPIWVALLFDKPTLQLNYSDPLLNGPFLANHFVAPINIFEKDSDEIVPFKDYIQQGVSQYAFGTHLPSKYDLRPLCSQQAKIAVRTFLALQEGTEIRTNEQLGRSAAVAYERHEIISRLDSASALYTAFGNVANWDTELIRIKLAAISPKNSFIGV